MKYIDCKTTDGADFSVNPDNIVAIQSTKIIVDGKHFKGTMILFVGGGNCTIMEPLEIVKARLNPVPEVLFNA